MKDDNRLLNMFKACEELCFFDRSMMGTDNEPIFKFAGTYALLKAYKAILGKDFYRYNDSHDDESVLPKIEKNLDFQGRFQKHSGFLSKTMAKCSVNTNPAENVLSDAEIRFVLCLNPEYANRVKEQSYFMQKLLINMKKASYLSNPGYCFAPNMTSDQVASVPFNSRGIDFEFYAAAYGRMPVKDMHLEQLPGYLIDKFEENNEVIGHSQKITIVRQVEDLGEQVFGKKNMEDMHLSFVETDVYHYTGAILNEYKSDGRYVALLDSKNRKRKPLLAYIKKPSDAVIRKAINHNPYVIYEIPQNDDLQELALKVCAEKRMECARERYIPFNNDINKYGNPWIMSILYNQFLKNPSLKIEAIYHELVWGLEH